MNFLLQYIVYVNILIHYFSALCKNQETLWLLWKLCTVHNLFCMVTNMLVTQTWWQLPKFLYNQLLLAVTFLQVCDEAWLEWEKVSWYQVVTHYHQLKQCYYCQTWAWVASDSDGILWVWPSSSDLWWQPTLCHLYSQILSCYRCEYILVADLPTLPTSQVHCYL